VLSYRAVRGLALVVARLLKVSPPSTEYDAISVIGYLLRKCVNNCQNLTVERSIKIVSMAQCSNHDRYMAVPY
jgi:hypothetical protein